MDIVLNRRIAAVFAAGVLAMASLAAADGASINLSGSGLVRVSGPVVDTTVEVADLAVVDVTVGTHQVERLASTVVPACDGAIAETSALVIDADGTTALGASSVVDVAPGAVVDCSLGN